MEERDLSLLVSIGVGTLLTIGLALFWDRLAALAKKFEPDPQKGFKKLFLAALALWALIGIAVSLMIMFRILGSGDPS